ncbi:MAG TPA: cyanophycin synthetase [Methylomirabilota bacterium]|nr:cyanophycin synthetase [Methylomirabilota bacterium]
MRLKDLVERLGPVRVEGPISREVRGITTDSRVVTPGMLYVALPESDRDYNRSIHAAVDRGAVAVVTEKSQLGKGAPRAAAIHVRDAKAAFARAASSWYSDPSTKLEIIGVTGQGATETALILKRLLCTLKRKAGLITPTRHEVGERFFPAPPIPRDALETQRLLAQMARMDCQVCVIELGDDPLAEAHALGLGLAKLILCGNAQSASVQQPRGCKTQLIAPVGAYADHGCRHYGIGAGEVRAERLHCSRQGAVFQLAIDDKAAHCAVESLGYQRVIQFLAAIAAIELDRAELEAVCCYARSITAIPGRLQRVAEGDGFEVYVDGAANAAAIGRLLNAVRPFAHQRLIVVGGASASDSAAQRQALGEALAPADVAIVTSNNPGNESPEIIAHQVARGVQAVKAGQVLIEVDRARAIEVAIGMAQRGDLILITGKGEATTDNRNGVIAPFDDAEVARRILQYRQLVSGLDPGGTRRETTPQFVR